MSTMTATPSSMSAAYLPGNSTVDLREVPVPSPGRGQVRVRVEASTICGSDIRAIYREHTGSGPEAYQDVIAGHEPCGVIESVGEDVKERALGDRVVVYHISGCGLCAECRAGYQIACTSPLRRAYGWQRDGGHAPYLIADERDLVVLPDSLTFLDGACVACGFGTAYEAVLRGGVTGEDSVFVSGLGPVGLAIGLLARAFGARSVVGSDPVATRRQRAIELGAVIAAVDPTSPSAASRHAATPGVAGDAENGPDGRAGTSAPAGANTSSRSSGSASAKAGGSDGASAPAGANTGARSSGSAGAKAGGSTSTSASTSAPSMAGVEGAFTVAFDASGNGHGQRAALGSIGRWGRCVLVGEGGSFTIDGSPDLIHKSATLMGSWVTSVPHMQRLVTDLDTWGLHPEIIVSHTFPLAEASRAYEVAAAGADGKVAILPQR